MGIKTEVIFCIRRSKRNRDKHLQRKQVGILIKDSMPYLSNPLLGRYCLQRFGIDNVAEINAAGVRIAKEVPSIPANHAL